MIGFDVVQRGSTVPKAADYERVASSRWPYLKIAEQGSLFLSSAGSVVNHKLGHFAPFLIFSDNFSSPVGIQPITVGSTISDSGAFYLTKNDLVYTGSSFTGHYIIFDYNLEIPRPGVSVGAGSSHGGAANTFGIKALDPNKVASINSQDYRDFSLNTGARNMAVHLNDSASPDSNNQIVVHHDLGYLPSYLAYKYNTSTDSIGNVVNIITGDTQVLTIKGAQAPLSGKHYYLILKEPI